MKRAPQYATEGRYRRDPIPNGPRSWRWECRLCAIRQRGKEWEPGGAIMRGFATKADAARDFVANHLDTMHALPKDATTVTGEPWVCACVKRDGSGRCVAIGMCAFEAPFCTRCGARRPRVGGAA